MTKNDGLIASTDADQRAAIQNAISFWADATTDTETPRRRDLLRDKQAAVESFFRYTGKGVVEVSVRDVKVWQNHLESLGLTAATVYYRLSRLSSFYTWLMRDPQLGGLIAANPVILARPKAPKKYQTESTQSLSNAELQSLVAMLRGRAQSACGLATKRDYALLLFYVLTGMRRSEVIGLRGCDVEVLDDRLLIKGKVKGGDYLCREVTDPSVRLALYDYLHASDRLSIIGQPAPLWTRHDSSGKRSAALTSHAFVKNLKRYAASVGIKKIHLHQTRHTYARLVAEESGSIIETQDALGHRNASTTRVYVQRIAIRKDKYSVKIAKLLSGSEGEMV